MKVLLIFLFVLSIYRRERFIEAAKANHKARIIGGQSATINEFPYAAAIDVQTRDSKFFCGGALITQEWILTAGQCVDGAILFTIRLGSASLNNNDVTLVTVATSDYFLHPDYNPETLENDVGLIKLRLQVEYTDYIRPIQPLATSELGAKSDIRAIGWGQTNDESGALSNELNYVYVASLSNQECKITFGNQIKDTMVCVEGNYNEGTCHGDTGSPLLDAYSKYAAIHVGIASFVSANGCESTDPSGYTRTYPYVNWINNVTKNN